MHPKYVLRLPIVRLCQQIQLQCMHGMLPWINGPAELHAVSIYTWTKVRASCARQDLLACPLHDVSKSCEPIGLAFQRDRSGNFHWVRGDPSS